MNGNGVYVLGGAQTDFQRNWTKEGKNVIALLKEVINDALLEVNLSYNDIIQLNEENKIACYVGNFIAENYINQGHLGALLTQVHPAFNGVPSARYEAACASSSVALDSAIRGIRVGDYEVAIVVGFELMKTVNSKVGGDILGRAAYYEEEGKDIEFPFPKLFGRLADETIRKYKLDETRYMDALAKIADTNYANAKKNPQAQTRTWFMNYEQARTRGTATNAFVGNKLAISDCSQVTDGACVVILANKDFIQSHAEKFSDCEFPIVKGFGHRVAPMLFDQKIEESKSSNYILPWTRQAVMEAYERANLTVDDMDVFETHDCFTSSEYAAISAFGITKPGEEYLAVEDGTICFEGSKPINPSGGLIGCGHPVGASGARMFLDLYKQIMKKAGDYQLPNVQNGAMLNIGGSATTNYVFILGKE